MLCYALRVEVMLKRHSIVFASTCMIVCQRESEANKVLYILQRGIGVAEE